MQIRVSDLIDIEEEILKSFKRGKGQFGGLVNLSTKYQTRWLNMKHHLQMFLVS